MDVGWVGGGGQMGAGGFRVGELFHSLGLRQYSLEGLSCT